MNLSLNVVLLVSLLAAGGAVVPKPPAKVERATSPIPAWARGLPPRNTTEYSRQLQKRIESGKVLRVFATVEEFLPVALASSEPDGSGVEVAGTSVGIVLPKRFAELVLLVHHTRTPAEDSCWREVGCMLVFDVHERMLEALSAGIYTRFLYDSDLQNLGFETPASRTKTRLPQPPSNRK